MGWWVANGLRDQVVWRMGGRWKIDGSRREGCGPGMPGPYGVAKGCAGVGRFRAIFVRGGVLDVPRRGQDPSLRCRGETGCVKQ